MTRTLRTKLLTASAALMMATVMTSAPIQAQAPAQAQVQGAPAAPKPAESAPAKVAAPSAAGRIERLAGVWIEGPGYDITYGGNYEACAQRCLAAAKCAMIEYYRPEKKCNLYDAVRPRKTGGASDVGIRR